jgi:hypothetical protein
LSRTKYVGAVPQGNASTICCASHSAVTRDKRSRRGHRLVIPNHQGTVTCPKPDTLWGSPQGDVELMTQKEVLDFKPTWWREQIGYEGCKQVDNRKHRIG